MVQRRDPSNHKHDGSLRDKDLGACAIMQHQRVDKAPKPVLVGEFLEEFLALAVRGYTVRRLKELMALQERNIDHVPDAYLVGLLRETLPTLKTRRESLDQDTRDLYGLADKWERIRRLCEAAELLESKVTVTHQWSGEYRRYLSQIQAELEPLGITFHAGDGWAQLLERVAKAGLIDPDPTDDQSDAADASVDERDPSAEGGDDQALGPEVLPPAVGGN